MKQAKTKSDCGLNFRRGLLERLSVKKLLKVIFKDVDGAQNYKEKVPDLETNDKKHKVLKKEETSPALENQ